MKLTTDIIPRRDGTVSVVVPGNGGVKYVFKPDADGYLVADVNEAHVPYLMNTGHFYPNDDGDVDAVLSAMAGGGDSDAAAGGDQGAPPAVVEPNAGNKGGNKGGNSQGGKKK